MEQQREFELQIWNGKVYEPTISGTVRDMVDAFEGARGRPRRLVDKAKARPLKPRYVVPHSHCDSRSAQDTVNLYFAWAHKHNLPSVAVYDRPQRNVRYPKTVPVRLVAVSDFLGPAPEGEPDDS